MIAEHPPSYYAATANRTTRHASLDGTAEADVCIVGGGYTGLSAALHLAERGYDVVLLEAERIGWGASGRNGGQVGSGQRKEQDALEKMVGRDDARRLWQLAEDAKALVKDLIRRHDIACDLKPGVIHAAHNARLAEELKHYAEFLQRHYDYPHVRALDRREVAEAVGSDVYFGGSVDLDAAHLHPLNYALGLADAASAAGARLHEGSRVIRRTADGPIRVETATGSVAARHLILACNGYLGNLEPGLAGHIMPINNFIIATEPLAEAKGGRILGADMAVADTKFVIDYFRLSADKRLLFGGGETYTSRFPDDIAGFVRKYMLRVFPGLSGAAIDYAWGGTLAVTMERMPHFTRLAHDVYSAQGFSGHGVAMATLAGKVIADAVAGTAESFDVFARVPLSRFPGGRLLRQPLLILGMLYYSLRDRL
ncbi:NAD(P)/FAD-dependent oxidoreductase [Oceanibacterium hippocampi]|uniref:Gamma-glutamylputrescine oxidoreductase n=1 Tax=Oceanibacterium hippocampi TaxID=745714 RepID=A0A1Y5U029_9PROT|nr:FAD-binding oxidoreductase [Oceanibacterium hippocampi]SLN73039.1 Gamma-glutamylputrescine oxidoreductase [Oceanibacterium hippocampi]